MDDDDFLLLLINKYLHYDPDTGVLTWKLDVGCRKDILAGTIAGSINYVGSTKLPRRIITLKGRRYYAHKLAVLITSGFYPKHQVDHIDHDTLNNRIDNLRVVTNIVNCKNKSKSKANTSGVTGVYFCRSKQRWLAKIGVEYKLINIGHYDSFEEAVAARKEAEVHHGFHPNHGK